MGTPAPRYRGTSLEVCQSVFVPLASGHSGSLFFPRRALLVPLASGRSGSLFFPRRALLVPLASGRSGPPWLAGWGSGRAGLDEVAEGLQGGAGRDVGELREQLGRLRDPGADRAPGLL